MSDEKGLPKDKKQSKGKKQPKVSKLPDEATDLSPEQAEKARGGILRDPKSAKGSIMWES